jgi:hypothetical protein
LVVFLRRWRKICTILKPIGKQGPIPEEIYSIPNLADQQEARKPEPTTLLSQRTLELTARNTLLIYKIL